MKQIKTLLSLFVVSLFLSVSFAKNYSLEEKEAYDYSYGNNITTMKSIDNADMGGNLTRIAMAKMVSNYAINILGLIPDESKNCQFSDVSDSLDLQYDGGVTKACQLGLMGVGIEEFNPNGKVTRAEFGTVLSRALNAESSEVLEEMNNASPYYDEHLKYLKGKGIMNNISTPSSLELRGWVMLMLMRADENYENSFDQVISISKNRNQEIFDILASYKVQKREYDVATNIDLMGMGSGYLNTKGWTKIDYDSKKEDAFVSFDIGMKEVDSFDVTASGSLNYSLIGDTMYFNLSDFLFKNSSPDQLAVATTMVDDLKGKWFKLELPEIDMSNIWGLYEQYRGETYDLMSKSYDIVNNEGFGIYNGNFDEYDELYARNYSVDKDEIRSLLETYFDTIQNFYTDLYAVQGLGDSIESEDFLNFDSGLSDITDDIDGYYVILGKNEVVQTFENVKLEFSDESQMLLNGHYGMDGLYVEISIDGEESVIDIKKKNNNSYAVSIMFGDLFEINGNIKLNKFTKEDGIDANFDLNFVMNLDEISYDEYENFENMESYPSKIIVPFKGTYKITKINGFNVSKHEATDLFDLFENYLGSYDDEYFLDDDL